MRSVYIERSPSWPLLHLLTDQEGRDCYYYHLYWVIYIPRGVAMHILVVVFLSVFLMASSSLYYQYHYICLTSNSTLNSTTRRPPSLLLKATAANISNSLTPFTRRHANATDDDDVVVVETVAVLFPDWEVLLIVPLEGSPPPPTNKYAFYCLYPNNATSPARASGVLPSTNQTTFKCQLPRSNRRRMPYPAPILAAAPSYNSINKGRGCCSISPPPPLRGKELLRWNFLAYESVSTEHDVVLFVKGINNKKGINRAPRQFRCVFYDDDDDDGNKAVPIIRTEVTSSMQEVFRCNHPPGFGMTTSSSSPSSKKLILPITRISLEIVEEKLIVPSVAYYYYHYYYSAPDDHPHNAPKGAAPNNNNNNNNNNKPYNICAATMVYNAAKFLREWVTYHSIIGVDKFILYDNDSDDHLHGVVESLKRNAGVNIETQFWMWPKAQEAGFSHAALKANRSCTWMMYVDVDEFVFSPSWITTINSSSSFSSSNPTAPNSLGLLLKSLLPDPPSKVMGQVSIKCNEFGPSNQRSNPVEGVTQGYTCRRKADNRHKSIVLLDAVHFSLGNAIHHFELKEMGRVSNNYQWKLLSLDVAVVNHYKYQAWSEFRTKFRRRVSAYVVDWTKNVNPSSRDRAPGLGFEPIEPPRWSSRFCEVKDERLKDLTLRWFGRQTKLGHRMAWQL